jgi:sulfur carrier protein
VRVRLRNPDRWVEVAGPRDVRSLLKHLGVLPETVLVIRGGELLTPEERLEDSDELEIRPVVSGGRP